MWCQRMIRATLFAAGSVGSYCLCDIVYDYGTVCVSVVHGCQRLVALLSCCVPDLELHGRLLIKGQSLCEESGADGGFSVVVELVLVAEISRDSCALSLDVFIPSQSAGQANSFRQPTRLESISILCTSTFLISLHSPRSTSLNCANLAPPGRPPCCMRWAMIGPRVDSAGWCCCFRRRKCGNYCSNEVARWWISGCL